MKSREQLLEEKKALEAEVERQKLENEVRELRRKTGKQTVREYLSDLLKTTNTEKKTNG